MSNSELKIVPLGDITISKTNPRKTFDLTAQKELIQSVNQHGILQPILIRPIPDSVGSKNQQLYELVCGERRYKAAKAAKKKEIPANIRTLTNDEAFELQIIENLERKDVHPLEEAVAFQRMLDSEKYILEDIMTKFVKPQSFIVQRLKLNDLIDELKEDFYKGFFGVGHAVILARLDKKLQQEQHESSRRGWNATPDNPDYGTIEQLRDDIEEDLYNLNDAPFDLKDKSFPDVCPCSVCPKHAAANPSLFPDVEEKDKCFDTTCYENKQRIYVERKVSKIINNAEEIYLGEEWRGEAPDFIKELCKQHKITILKDNDWRKVYDEDKKDKASKMLIVGGSDAGHIIPITITRKLSADGSVSSEPTEEDQLQKIKDRAKRALELDNEKVEAAIREKLEALPQHNFYNDKPFDEHIEIAAAILSIYVNLGYENRKWFQEELAGIKGYYHDYGEKKVWDFILANGNEIMLRECLRRLTFKTLTDRQVSDKKSNGFSDAFYKLSKLHHKEVVIESQGEQDEIAKKRIERTDAKLKKLKDSLIKK